jgi:serine/threonine protein kinase/Flp pilus assembly protein TadD
MSENNDELVMSLVESALERSPEELEPYLQSVCGGNPDLYQDVRKRVEWEQRMGHFLRDPLIPSEIMNPRLEPGTRLADRFRIVRELGSGGMGVVYEAVDEKLNRRIAVKCAKAGFWARLPPEARSAREVSHYNVCKVHDVHTALTPWGDLEFLTMELIEGETLAEILKRSGPPPVADAHEIARQICAGLAQAHLQGVIHGDLKSSNILIAKSSEGAQRTVITDFGLAKMMIDGGPHAMSERGGTSDYMAPELFRGERASVATDIYALGVLLHVILKGNAPARASDPDRREVKNLPSPWQRVVVRCLEPRAENRFQTVEAVWRALEGRRLFAPWQIAAIIVVTAALVFTLWRSREKPLPPIRLAVLPFSIAGRPVASAVGIANDVANRLSGLRRNLDVISPREAIRNQIRTIEDANRILSPTHVLETRLENNGTVILAFASLIDTGTGRTIRDLKGDYAFSDAQVLTKALIATVTRALDLRSDISKELVSAAAYPDFIQGMALLQRDRRSADEAIPFFDKALAIDGRSALPYAARAEAEVDKYTNSYGSQWLDRAKQTIAKAKSLNADAVPVLLASGSVNQAQGFYEQAVQDFSRAAEIEENNADTLRRLAIVYDLMNRPEDANASYRKAIAVQPGSYRAYSDFAIFHYRRGRYREAEDLMGRVIELAPNLDSGHGNLGVFLMDDGHYQEAEKEMLQALRLRESEMNLSNLGALYNYEGRDQEAILLYQRGLAIGPPTVADYLNLGDTYRRLDRAPESWDAYRQGRELAERELVDDPRRSFSRADLALFCARLGDRGRAEFEIAQALQMAPEDAKIKRVAALTFEALKQRPNTLKVLQNAPADVLGELSRQPDLHELQKDPSFIELVAKKSSH